jgi:hypothetical protein
MKGKLYKENDSYTLFVDGKIFGDTRGHHLSSITNTLSVKNCQAIELDYDLDELISESDTSHLARWTSDSHELMFDEGFKIGFQKALELMGDKKFSEDDLRLAMHFGKFGEANNQTTTIGFIQSLQQTEWDVEVVMEKFDLSFGCYKIQTKFDEEGCLILKRI